MARSPHRPGLVLLLPALATALPATRGEAQQERLSPLDSVTAVVKGAEIAIQYGRPSVRGREIFGGLVPWNRVWRTGANEATHIRTSADLRMADATIPAGRYTLYTIPGPDGWTLIVNEQTGQWGTEYHQERDLARVPMRGTGLESPVETFTISVSEGTESDGILAMEWERTRAWVPFEVSPARPAEGDP